MHKWSPDGSRPKMNQDESYKNRVVGLKKDLIQGGQFWLTRGRSGGEEEAGPEFMVGTNANYPMAVLRARISKPRLSWY